MKILVKVRWCGHDCFEIKGKEVVIGTDPFTDAMVGLETPKMKADIVLSSHQHGDHYDRRTIKEWSKEDTEVLKWKNESFEIKGVKIKGIATAHDDKDGQMRGSNTVYVFTIDEITFCHCGDLGHMLSDEQVKEIGKIDVLFIPVGGFFTIDPATASKVVEQLKPKIVIPMHYKHKGLASTFDKLSTVDDFLKDKKNVKKIDSTETEITKEKLPEKTEIWAFKPVA